MSDPVISQQDPARRRSRRRLAVIGAAVLAALAVFVLVYFQPQKLFIDDTVDEAAPSGAVPLGGAAAPSTDDAMTEEPMTEDSMMEEPMTEDSMAEEPMTEDSMAEEPMTDEPVVAPQPAAFVSLDHQTSGTLLFLEDPSTGERFVRFEDLATDNGPDLKVYLSTNPADGPEGAFDDDFVDLGPLQGNIGDQNYVIPADVDLSRYASVVIWCDRFDSGFGVAPILL